MPVGDNRLEPGGSFHVTVRFTADGPVVEGIWEDPRTAVHKFRGFIGTYGSLEKVVICLTEEAPNSRELLRTWTFERGGKKSTRPGLAPWASAASRSSP